MIQITKTAILVTIFSVFLVSCGSEAAKNEKPLKTVSEKNTLTASDWGDASDFTLPLALEEGDFTLSSLKGKVIILDFWATWCPPCRMEIPGFVELQNKYKEQGLEIVGVTLDMEGPGVIAPFAEEMGINYTLVLGDEPVTIAYGGIRGIPTTFIIDREGNIRGKHIGYAPKEVFEKQILELL
ncbi:MAG: TlpA disulfide reductase family protein [Elusimicrobiota bacterium]